jgi:hypothetical protein
MTRGCRGTTELQFRNGLHSDMLRQADTLQFQKAFTHARPGRAVNQCIDAIGNHAKSACATARRPTPARCPQVNPRAVWRRKKVALANVGEVGLLHRFLFFADVIVQDTEGIPFCAGGSSNACGT